MITMPRFFTDEFCLELYEETLYFEEKCAKEAKKQQGSDMRILLHPLSQAMNSLMLTKTYLYDVMNHQSCNHTRWLAMEVGTVQNMSFCMEHGATDVLRSLLQETWA